MDLDRFSWKFISLYRLDLFWKKAIGVPASNKEADYNSAAKSVTFQHDFFFKYIFNRNKDFIAAEGKTAGWKPLYITFDQHFENHWITLLED